MNDNQEENSRLPLWRNLFLAYIFSVIIALVMTAVSIIGLLYQETIYPSRELLLGLVPTDILNLAIGVPVLLVSMWLTKRGKLIGLLCWPGALFYVLYIYMTYLIAVPFGVLFMPYLLLITLSGYTMIGLVASTNANKVRERLTDEIPAKVAGGILAGLTIAFMTRQVVVIIITLIDQTPVERLDLALWISDFIMSPAWLSGGFLLWRREALGYMAGAGLFLLYSILFIGLVPVIAMQGFYSGTPIDFIGITVVLVLSMVCLIPLGYFIRAAEKTG